MDSLFKSEAARSTLHIKQEDGQRPQVVATIVSAPPHHHHHHQNGAMKDEDAHADEADEVVYTVEPDDEAERREALARRAEYDRIRALEAGAEALLGERRYGGGGGDEDAASSSGGGSAARQNQPARRRRRRRRPRDDEAEEVNDSDAEDGGGDSVPKVILRIPSRNPLWLRMFDRYGIPKSEELCYGCKRMCIDAARLPQQTVGEMARKLRAIIVENGLVAGIEWSEHYFQTVVVRFLRDMIPLIDEPLYQWRGIDIVWHFFKHSFIEEFRQLCTVIELTDVKDRMVMDNLYSRIEFESEETACVIKPSIDNVTRVELLLNKVKSAEARKTCTSHSEFSDHPGRSGGGRTYSGRGVARKMI